jgi:hypothetical protein
VSWTRILACCCLAAAAATAQDSAAPPGRWTEIAKDLAGARPGSALRYVPEAHAFFLWGFMNDDPELPQEQPLMQVPEYDMVFFEPDSRRWQNHLPAQFAKQWSRRLPLAYVPRT